MRRIRNPHTESVKIRYGNPGNAIGYEIRAGEVGEFNDQQNEIADYFLETFGFLVEMEVGNDAFACSKCGKNCKNNAGKSVHEKHCQVVARSAVMQIPDKNSKSRSEMESASFNDMPEIASGQEKTEVIGGRVQKIVYDRDGVGWYGPGLEDDFVPQSRIRPGQF